MTCYVHAKVENLKVSNNLKGKSSMEGSTYFYPNLTGTTLGLLFQRNQRRFMYFFRNLNAMVV